MRFESVKYWFRKRLIAETLRSPGPEIIGEYGAADSGQKARRSLNPSEPGYVADPYPTFEYLREIEPLHRTQIGPWALTRYDDIVNALTDDRLGNSPSEYSVVHHKNSDQYACADVCQNILPFIDPPLHTHLRQLVNKAFRQHISQYPPPIESLVKEQLNSQLQKDQFDLLHEFATPVVCAVFGNLLGIPKQDHSKLIEWTEWFLYLFTIIPSIEVREKIDNALTEFRVYLKNVLRNLDSNPLPSLLRTLQQVDKDGKRLNEEQIIDNCMLLFSDGIGNSDKGIANAFLCLKQHPGQLKLLQRNPDLMDSAVDECLRYESPAQYIGRVAREDIVLYGQSIKKNEVVLLVLASANRDSGKFQNPERLDIQRSPNPHLSFGKSRHSCIGGAIVEQEIKIALKVILRHIDNLELCNEAPNWDIRPGHRWLRECPVSVVR